MTVVHGVLLQLTSFIVSLEQRKILQAAEFGTF